MIGTRLANRYEIVRELGHGGMGVVYLAHDPALEREVAIKLVPPTSLSKDTEERLKREARLVAKLDHPAVVVVHDIGEHEGSLFFVMPFVGGTNLQSLLLERTLRLGDVLEIGIQVCEALEYAHELGIVHRDVKPENLMVARTPDGLRVRITDFGLAIATRRRRLTRSGMAVGTVSYCSPEQVSAEEVDGRSDLYSLGSVLYQCVTGRPPFAGDVQAVLYRIVRETPESPRAMGAVIDEELDAIVMGCLEKDRARRPQSARELKESLLRYRGRLKEGEEGRALGAGEEEPAPSHRQPLLNVLVGREREFGELQRRLNAAIASECQLVVVSGDVGTGKSRLLAELEELARARDVRVLHGRFVEQDRAFPYQGFCEVLQEFFKAKSPSGSSSIPDFTDLAPELFALFPVLTEIGELHASQTGELKPSLDAALQLDDRLHVFELLARTIARLLGGKPLVILLEDLHAGDVSVEALGYVIRRLGPSPVLFVATYRTGDVGRGHPLVKLLDSFQGDRRFVELLLGPLSRTDHRAFLSSVAGGAQVDSGIADRLYETSEGNPYFARELVLSLLDSGEMRKDAGVLVASSGELEPAHALPRTIHQAVTKRIERLPESLQELLSLAAVLGRSFPFKDLVLLSGEEREKVDESLDRLLADGFLEEERASRGDRLAFVSGVTREVLYAALPRRQRKKLHRRYAEELERQHEGRLERVTPQLLTHYAAAGVIEKVLEYGLVYARRSLEAWSADEAARAARLVLESLEELETPDVPSELEARSLLASALRHAGDTDAALQEIEKAKKLTAGGAASPKVCLLGAEIAWQARRVDDARRSLDLGILAARTANDAPTLVKLLSLAATVANLRGDLDRARVLLEEAEALVPEPGEKAELPRGGRLTVAVPVLVRATEPWEILLNEEAEILSNVYQTLVRTDADGNPVPLLLERWEPEDGGRSFLLTVRGGVKLSDGRELTADLVAASFVRGMARHGTPAAYLAIDGAVDVLAGAAETVPGIEVVSERQLRVRLVEPLPIYPALLSDAKSAIAVEPLDGREGAAVGTGPFRLASVQTMSVLLERNRALPPESAPRLDVVEFQTGLHAAQIASGFRAGEYDVARDLLPEDLEQILRDRQLRAGIAEVTQRNTYFVLFGKGSRQLTSPAARLALGGVVRTQDLVRRTLGRFAQPADGLLPPGILGHDAGRRRQPITREAAVELLENAAIPRPLRLAAAVHPVFQDRYLSLTKGLLEVWADLGVEVSIETPTMTTYLERGERSEGIDLLLGRWIADYEDPDNFAYALFRSEGGRFRNFVSSRELDDLIEEARVESRPAHRERLYRKFEQRLLEDGSLLPLFHDIEACVASPRVLGLKLRAGSPSVNYAELAKAEAPEPSRAARGIVRVPIAGEVHSLDPSLAFTVVQFEVVSTVFETLTKETEGARVIPWLASSFRAEEGGRRFRFRLREDVKFSDDRRLTARDVRYSFERLLLDADNKNRGILSPIVGAEELLAGERGDLEGFRIVSASEFTIELAQPVAFFPALLAHTSTSIVPEGTDPLNDSWKNRCAGTGPFRVSRFDPGRRLELEANHAYWRLGVPKSEGLVFSFGATPSEILSGYRAGRFSLAWDLFPEDVEALRHDPELGAQYKETPVLSTYYLVLNARKGPLADEELRRELVRAVDVAGLVRRHLGRLAIPAHGLIPPGLLGHETAAPLGRADGRARRSVDLAGIFHSVFEGTYSSLAKDLLAQLRERGFSVRLEKDTRSDYQRAIDSHEADFLAGRWVADYPDSDSFVYGLLHTEKGLFGRMAGTPALDRLIGLGRTETNPEVRHEIYREAEDEIRRRALLLPLFHEQAYRFARPEIEGFDVTFSSPIVAYERLSVRRES